MPYVFDQFELDGQIPPLSEIEALYEAQAPIPVDTSISGPRTNTLPLGSNVVTFASAGESEIPRPSVVRDTEDSPEPVSLR